MKMPFLQKLNRSIKDACIVPAIPLKLYALCLVQDLLSHGKIGIGLKQICVQFHMLWLNDLLVRGHPRCSGSCMSQVFVFVHHSRQTRVKEMVN